MTEERPEIEYGFFCEFVRPEQNGKTTAIGMWGDVCRYEGAPPAPMPNLGLHVYIANRRQIPYNVVVRLDIPGLPEPAEFRFALASSPGAVGSNLNLNIANLVFTEPGRVRAKVIIEADPPVERDFVLRVEFLPPGTTTASGGPGTTAP